MTNSSEEHQSENNLKSEREKKEIGLMFLMHFTAE
jgi:hypothetical protein